MFTQCHAHCLMRASGVCMGCQVVVVQELEVLNPLLQLKCTNYTLHTALNGWCSNAGAC
jgi:hypothetical protein